MPGLPPMDAAARQARLAGPLVDSSRLPRVIEDLLRRAIGGYLDEAARQDGDPGKVQRPRSYQTHPARLTDQLAERSLPRIVIVDGGTTGDPFGPDSRGEIGHQWSLGVSATVAGRDETDALLKAGSYGAAIRKAIVEHACEVHDQIASVEWLGTIPGSTSRLVDKEQRSIAVTEEQFEFRIIGVLNVGSALPLPDLPPDGEVDHGDAPLIERADITLKPTLEVER